MVEWSLQRKKAVTFPSVTPLVEVIFSLFLRDLEMQLNDLSEYTSVMWNLWNLGQTWVSLPNGLNCNVRNSNYRSLISLKAAPTLETLFEFSIDSKRAAQNMAEVQFSWPSDRSLLKKSPRKTRPDELSFPLREIFWNPRCSQVKVDKRISQKRLCTVVFVI